MQFRPPKRNSFLPQELHSNFLQTRENSEIFQSHTSETQELRWFFWGGSWGTPEGKRGWSINQTLYSGDQIWCRGPNGSGKSTWLTHVFGLRTPWTGHGSFPVSEMGQIGTWMETETKGREHDTIGACGDRGRSTDEPVLPSEEEQWHQKKAWYQVFQWMGSVFPWNQPRDDSFQGAKLGAPWHSLSSGQRKKVRWSEIQGEEKPLGGWDEVWASLDISAKQMVDHLVVFQTQIGGRACWTSHEERTLPLYKVSSFQKTNQQLVKVERKQTYLGYLYTINLGYYTTK
uniref:Heme ABC exporter ATP-binding protein CcmA n=1 Tax=Hemiarma marina TaxID=1848298 RepID=A0A679ELF4_9CRYP|nr:heme ABC exporter ATP-binding protein CcmA [Hemiarma marina]